jgi:hypothetical protein
MPHLNSGSKRLKQNDFQFNDLLINFQSPQFVTVEFVIWRPFWAVLRLSTIERRN